MSLLHDFFSLLSSLTSKLTQVTRLLNQSREEWEVSNKTENKLNEKLQENELLERKLLNMSQELERSKSNSNFQIESGNQLERMFNNIMDEISKSANQSSKFY